MKMVRLRRQFPCLPVGRVYRQRVMIRRFLNLSGTGFKDEQRNHLTKRASLPLPLNYRLFLSISVVPADLFLFGDG